MSLKNASRKYSRIVRAHVFKFFTDLTFYARLRAIYIFLPESTVILASFSRSVPKQRMFPLLLRTYICQSWCLARSLSWQTLHEYVEIKGKLDVTDWFLIAKPTVRLTCFGHHYADHQELKSYTDGCCLSYLALWFTGRWSGVELWVMCTVCGMHSVVVKALRYKSEGPGNDSRCRRDFLRGIWQFHVPWGRPSL